MSDIILVIHVMIAVALIGVVLLQRSEGGGLGIGGGGGGGGGGGMSGFLTGRGTANVLTRTTAILAAAFMATSITLSILAGGTEKRSIVDDLPVAAPSSQSGDGETQQPAKPDEPAVPVE